MGIGMHPPVAVVLKASLQSNQITLRYTCSVTCEGSGEGGGVGGGGVSDGIEGDGMEGGGGEGGGGEGGGGEGGGGHGGGGEGGGNGGGGEVTFWVLVSTLSMDRTLSCAHASSFSDGQNPDPELLCARIKATFGRVCLS